MNPEIDIRISNALHKGAQGVEKESKKRISPVYTMAAITLDAIPFFLAGRQIPHIEPDIPGVIANVLIGQIWAGEIGYILGNMKYRRTMPFSSLGPHVANGFEKIANHIDAKIGKEWQVI